LQNTYLIVYMNMVRILFLCLPPVDSNPKSSESNKQLIACWSIGPAAGAADAGTVAPVFDLFVLLIRREDDLLFDALVGWVDCIYFCCIHFRIIRNNAGIWDCEDGNWNRLHNADTCCSTSVRIAAVLVPEK
jgi:hypothetical protein